jgi:hypothetical protein
MHWSKKDKIFFRIIEDFGKSDLEKQIGLSSDAFSKLHHRPESFTLFGYYDKEKQIFVWENDMNHTIKRFMEEGYQPVFGSDTSWKNLFRSTVPLPSRHKNVIPYLMEIVNARYRVVRLSHPNYDIYALVSLQNIKETFSYEEFSNAMFLYRIDDQLEKKYGLVPTKKRRRVQ